MHPNRVFRTESEQRNLEYAKKRGFGTLAVSTEEAPLLSHVPFLVSDDSSHIELHLVRSNPIARLLDTPRPAKLAIMGPDSYVSPDWYELDDQVPTWNYIAVHLTGSLAALPDEDLPGLLERESAFFEEQLSPKPPWRMDKVDPEALGKMMKAIMPCRLEISGIDGTWKLNQNKPADVRQRAADHIAAADIGAEVAALADHQRTID
ncbi:MAG: FMN-binding negative transcriptional regulator [Acidimicrobiales bacterium]|nr:MAG: FMN-binding negative transcriptional regulator [Acidimicrobiales bacterium]